MMEILDIDKLMAEVQARTITARKLAYSQAGELAADPVLSAAEELYNALRVAVRTAVTRGLETARATVDAVVATWERLRDELGDLADALLQLFQEQMGLLVAGALSNAAKSLPLSLATAWPNELDTVSAKIAWSVTPSVRVAVDGWLSIAVGGGLDVSATYKRITG